MSKARKIIDYAEITSWARERGGRPSRVTALVGKGGRFAFLEQDGTKSGGAAGVSKIVTL